MTVDKTKKTIVIGHKNPDTDSMLCHLLREFEADNIRRGICAGPGRPRQFGDPVCA